MQISALLNDLRQPFEVLGPVGLSITSITNDSREVQQGSMFAAVPGSKVDGCLYALDAYQRGAVAILANRVLPVPYLVQIIVSDVRQALGELLSAYHGHPSRNLKLLGVTGTNGKTTVTYMVESILNAAGMKTGLIGTVLTRYANVSRRSTHTSPDSPLLQRTLAEMRKAGVEAGVMELSSHALALKRPAGTALDGFAITNITHDHLDFHNTFDEYRNSKLSGLNLLADKPAPFVVANLEDKSFSEVASRWKGLTYPFALRKRAAICLLDAVWQGGANHVTIQTPFGQFTATVNLPGDYNMANALAATGMALGLGVPLKYIAQGISSLKYVPGRFQKVHGEVYTGVVDFAHNPDGLMQLLKTARSITPGRVILVFGCQGRKDMQKRPIMGEIAAKFADEAILTTDDWYDENPMEIFDMIKQGYLSTRGDGLTIIWRRDDAIHEAVQRATPEDLVVVAGRGPERALVLGETTYDFDDAEFLQYCIHEKERNALGAH